MLPKHESILTDDSFKAVPLETKETQIVPVSHDLSTTLGEEDKEEEKENNQMEM